MRADVMELPLFPLNVVLFPGQTLPLHIFEPRYRTMIQRCIEQGQPFGVVLAQDDNDGTPHAIGTAARITQVERLPDGRMNILTVGVERFVLQNIYEGEDDYLIGDALFYPFKDDAPLPNQLRNLVIARLRRYLTLLATMSGAKFRFEQFPNDATAVAVFAAIALQLPLQKKQELLAIESVNQLLSREADLLKSELLQLSIMAASVHPVGEGENIVFSRN
jgi:Lon protease-like protein